MHRFRDSEADRPLFKMTKLANNVSCYHVSDEGKVSEYLQLIDLEYKTECI